MMRVNLIELDFHLFTHGYLPWYTIEFIRTIGFIMRDDLIVRMNFIMSIHKYMRSTFIMNLVELPAQGNRQNQMSGRKRSTRLNTIT